MFEEKEENVTSLQELIDIVERDIIPTNEFTIEDKDPMVILGKLNEVVAYLKTLQATINSSDAKANEALQQAIQAVSDATQALNVANGIDAKATSALENAINAVATANTALNASNTALNTSNTAISTANTAISSANSAVETAIKADTTASTAITTANNAKTIAEGIDAKATNALTNSNTAISTADQAKANADNAQSVASTANINADSAKVIANNALEKADNAKEIATDAQSVANTAITTANNANTTADQALNISNTANTNANTALQNANTALTTANSASSTANDAKRIANEALNQVVSGLGTKVYRGTSLLTELDIKTLEEQTLLNTQEITALNTNKVEKEQGKGLSTNDYTTAEKNKLAGLNNYNDTQVKADITALQTRATTIETKNNEQDTAINNLTTNKADKSEIPTDNSQIGNGAGYLKTSELLNKIYPVGSIYLTINAVSPSSFIGGTWVQLPHNHALWLVTSGVGTQLRAGLPNIKGAVDHLAMRISNGTGITMTGAFSGSSDGGQSNADGVGSNAVHLNFNANNGAVAKDIYRDDCSTVQPPAYTVYGWRRIE